MTKTERKQKEYVCHLLETWFPWLGSNEDVNGSDVINSVNELWNDICDDLSVEDREKKPE